MAKRLYMTSADYLAIAISPALVMALVGSLVFFLIEVLYVGQYQARLNYAFALFVFATVLIARISIEMGSERAALFALPLGIAMFLFLLRFVEHPNPFSHLINLVLLAVVWWCAHQLTWDSTLIDDDEDASGEGLMQRMGVDGPANADSDEQFQIAPSAAAKGNELLNEPGTSDSRPRSWWQRMAAARNGPHTPGLWVLYFSLAALPLFGIGQHWIPAAETGRRRYVFVLLLVYVAAALALLVTTSFLNLRRYLRQRHVEMPLPIAGTWVGVGAVLIAVVMLLAALIPRPGAEIALSRVPWQAGSPGDLIASRTSVNRDGGEQQAPENARSGDKSTMERNNDGQPQNSEDADATSDASDAGGDSSTQREGRDSSSAGGDATGNQEGSEKGDGSDTGESDADGSTREARDSSQPEENSDPNNSNQAEGQPAKTEIPNEPDETTIESTEQPDDNQEIFAPRSPQTVEAIQNLPTTLGGLAGVLKIIFYLIVAILVAYFVWKYRQQILQAIADLLRQLRELFSGKQADAAANDTSTSASGARMLSFRDFDDPFATGQHERLPPDELVRYTFAAFESWANDRGRPRTPDCTPQELVGLTLDPETPMYAKARRLVRLYGEVAYASRQVPRESVNDLREFWQMMNSTRSRELTGTAH
jgi:hypothetical protein